MATKLTAKMVEFAKHYKATNNASQAARMAGYSEGSAANMGSRLLKDPRIQAMIEQHKEVLEALERIDTAWVVRETVDTYKSARDQNQNAAALTALQLLAKHTGGFDGGEAGSGPQLHLHGLSPDEIRQIARMQLPSEQGIKPEPVRLLEATVV